jgi:hypothetical protein
MDQIFAVLTDARVIGRWKKKDVISIFQACVVNSNQKNITCMVHHASQYLPKTMGSTIFL